MQADTFADSFSKSPGAVLARRIKFLYEGFKIETNKHVTNFSLLTSIGKLLFTFSKKIDFTR